MEKGHKPLEAFYWVSSSNFICQDYSLINEVDYLLWNQRSPKDLSTIIEVDSRCSNVQSQECMVKQPKSYLPDTTSNTYF